MEGLMKALIDKHSTKKDDDKKDDDKKDGDKKDDADMKDSWLFCMLKFKKNQIAFTKKLHKNNK